MGLVSTNGRRKPAFAAFLLLVPGLLRAMRPEKPPPFAVLLHELPTGAEPTPHQTSDALDYLGVRDLRVIG